MGYVITTRLLLTSGIGFAVSRKFVCTAKQKLCRAVGRKFVEIGRSGIFWWSWPVVYSAIIAVFYASAHPMLWLRIWLCRVSRTPPETPSACRFLRLPLHRIWPPSSQSLLTPGNEKLLFFVCLCVYVCFLLYFFQLSPLSSIPLSYGFLPSHGGGASHGENYVMWLGNVTLPLFILSNIAPSFPLYERRHFSLSRGRANAQI